MYFLLNKDDYILEEIERNFWVICEMDSEKHKFQLKHKF